MSPLLRLSGISKAYPGVRVLADVGFELNAGRVHCLVGGTLLGAVLIGVLRNGLNHLDVNSYVPQVVVGFVILIAVMMDQSTKK